MKYEIVTLPETIVSGLKTRTTNAGEQAVTDIGALWHRLFAEDLFTKIPNTTDSRAIGLYTEYEGDATQPYTFMCGLSVSSACDEFDSIVIPSGKYAKFTVVGDTVSVVGQAWEQIWAMDLPRKYTCDFELYHNDSEDMSNQSIDIFVAID